jgi:ribosome-binding ATPase
MALQIGIVGLPNVGKSTLFNALIRTKAADAQNYPFCTIDPNVGVVEVPDERLTKIVEIVKPEKVIPASIEFVDIAGLVAGAHKGEGLGNQFLSTIRECDAICEVVRVFDNGDIVHVAGSVDPKRDREIIETELIFADLAVLEKRKQKWENAAKTGNKEAKEQMAVIDSLMDALNKGQLASAVSFPEEKQVVVKALQLLTSKPLLYAVNVSEEQLGSLSHDEALERLGFVPDVAAGTRESRLRDAIVLISAKIEEDLMDLSHDDAREFLKDLGVESSGLDQLIKAAYDLLGFQTFFTAGPKECRAWTIKKGATAPEAAGVIHTDFQKGFIRAETISYLDFIEYGGENGAKEKGKMRSEGKEYRVCDGDVMHFRFNV